MQSHQKMRIILQITACRQHFSHKLTHSCTHLLILTLFEVCLVYSERKSFSFNFKCSAILRLQIFSTVCCQLQVLANLVYCTVNTCNMILTNLICNESLFQQTDMVEKQIHYMLGRRVSQLRDCFLHHANQKY